MLLLLLLLAASLSVIILLLLSIRPLLPIPLLVRCTLWGLILRVLLLKAATCNSSKVSCTDVSDTNPWYKSAVLLGAVIWQYKSAVQM